MTLMSIGRWVRRIATLSAVGVLGSSVILGVSGCSTDPNSLEAQARSGNRAGYAAGDGSITQVAAASRGDAIALEGATVDGKQWSRTVDGAGKVVVVNVWGSWCAPCVEETPTLQKVWTAYQAAGKPVAFIGVDIKEPADMGKAFLAAKGVTYPSISDQASESRPMLALAGKTPATPTTLVLDRQGRVAARVLGPVTESTLRALIDDAIAEP